MTMHGEQAVLLRFRNWDVCVYLSIDPASDRTGRTLASTDHL